MHYCLFMLCHLLFSYCILLGLLFNIGYVTSCFCDLKVVNKFVHIMHTVPFLFLTSRGAHIHFISFYLLQINKNFRFSYRVLRIFQKLAKRGRHICLFWFGVWAKSALWISRALFFNVEIITFNLIN